MENSRFRKVKSNVVSVNRGRSRLSKETAKSKKEQKSGWFQRFKDKMTGGSRNASKEKTTPTSSGRRPSQERMSREKTKENRTIRTRETQEEASKQQPMVKPGSAEQLDGCEGSKEAIVARLPSKENVAKLSKEQSKEKKDDSKERKDTSRERKENSREKKSSDTKERKSSESKERKSSESKERKSSESKERKSSGSKERKSSGSKSKEKSKVQMRKRPSFQHDKRVKTTKDIQEEMNKQSNSKMGNLNILEGTNGRKYEKKDLVCKGKKGLIFRAQDLRPGYSDTKLVVKMSTEREAMNNEVRFLLEFQQTLRDQTFGADHILPICAYGAVAEYGWLVQPMCGPNLDQLRQQMDAEFSPHTALRLGLMALDAISCLHLCDVVHGRIEPQHFVIGCDTMKSNIYLVGLGHIVQANAPPPLVWSKNVSYSPSRNYKDPFNTEIETWLYLLLDLYGRSHLPWNKRRWADSDIQKWKEALFMFPVLLPPHFPVMFHDLFTIIAKCDENDTVATRAIRRRILDHLKQEKISRQLPFEWEFSELEHEANMAANRDSSISKLYLKRGKALRDMAKELLKDFHSNEGET